MEENHLKDLNDPIKTKLLGMAGMLGDVNFCNAL
jgi:hypothetical protein